MAPIKLGILTGSTIHFSPWQLRLCGKILNDSRFQIAALITGAPATASPYSRFARHVLDFEKTYFARDTAGSTTDAVRALAAVPVVSHNIEALSLDVLLVFGQDSRTVELSRFATFGAWSLQYAGQLLTTDSLEQAAATLDDAQSIRVSLERVTDGGAVRSELSSAVFNIERTPSMTLNRAAEKAVSLIWRDLRRLAANGNVALSSVTHGVRIDSRDVLSTGHAILKVAIAVANTAAATAVKKVLQKAGRRPMMWSLFFGDGAFETAALPSTREVRPADGEFWADPFLISHNGETFVFFENYVYAAGKGKITAGIYRNKQLQIVGDALDRPYHLSFPLVFEDGGDVYMIPETCGAQRLEVWRAKDFPLTWELHAVALDGLSVADPVLYKDEDTKRWWLFVNISDTPFEDHCNELHVFEVDGPALTRITPHALNPVVIGSDTARNAGRIVRRDGRLLRMSQNNTRGVYGYGLNVMEITQLDLDRYEERLVSTVSPAFKSGLIGCHHMDQVDGLFAVDGCRRFG